MASIFDRGERDALKKRVMKLRPETARQWGKMDATRMQVHLIAGFKMGLGTLKVAPKKSPLANWFGRWLVIHSPMPWPKGAPTVDELKDLPSADFEAEQAELLGLIDTVGARGHSDGWPPHPIFGELSTKDWGVLAWRHADHHLRQFGV